MSSGGAIVDTGPLVALLNGDDTHHNWAKHQVADLAAPLFTCEAVLAEAWHLLRRSVAGREAILAMLRQGTLAVRFQLSAEAAAVEQLAARYRDVPMSLADACLVRMSELYPNRAIFTVDSDFSVYRRNGRQVIPLIAP